MVDARDSKSRVRKGMSVQVRPRPFYFLKKLPLQQLLLPWYHIHKRDLPWRRSSDPYAILVSEMMLQQTQVQTVIPYYERWLRTFPTFSSLAKASLNQVLKAWEGLGYYSRARNLHALAHRVLRDFKGHFPSDFKDALSLPGIGRYTAGAVLSIAFGKRFPVLDGNVVRVFCRYFGIHEEVSRPQTLKTLWQKAEELLPLDHPGDYNQALMELGAMVCTPRNPSCLLCPLRLSCVAYAQGLQEKLPRKKKKAATPHKNIGAAIIWKAGKILISQRPASGLLGGLWEFPGGKLESGETLPECVKREIMEELGIRIRVGKKVAKISHAYSHFRITLHAFDCTYQSGSPQKLGVQDWRWVEPLNLRRYAFPAANQPVIDQLIRRSQADPSKS